LGDLIDKAYLQEINSKGKALTGAVGSGLNQVGKSLGGALGNVGKLLK
jgi:hypothetical protein